MATFEDGERPYEAPPLLAWDQVIHIKPRYRLTRADVAELKLADREHRAPQLSDEALAAVASRAKFLDDQANSSLPEWRKEMVKVVTTLDNIQDQISTISWITGPLLDKLGPKGKAIHAVADATAGAINWTQKLIAGPQPSSSKKHQRALNRSANARAKGGVAGTLQKGVEWVRRNQGHLLEAGQATDTWFGVGISLGAVFGALEETYWRTGTQAYHVALSSLNLAAAELLDLSPQGKAALLQNVDDYARAGITDPLPPPVQMIDWLAEQLKHTATEGTLYNRITYGLEYLLGPSDKTGADASLLALAALKQGTVLGDQLPMIADAIGADNIPNLLMPSPRVRDPATRLMLEQRGASFDNLGRPLHEYAPHEQTVAEHLDEILPRYIADPKTWLPPATNDPRAQVIHQLLEANQAATAQLLTGNVNGIKDTYPPDDAAIMYAIEQHIAFPPDATREQLAGWFDAVTVAQTVNPDAWQRGGMARISSDYWRRLVAR